MRQSSKKTSAVCEARRPCFLTFVPISRPLVFGGMTNAAWPRAPRSRSTEATTTWTLAMPPLVAQAFWPLRTHSSLASSYLARVRREETSEPASGSETQKAATFGSSGVPKHCGIHSPICSGVPLAKMPATASELPMIAMPMPASPQKSSSLTIGQRQAGGVGEELGEGLEAVEADLLGLLDDRARASPRARPTRRRRGA